MLVHICCSVDSHYFLKKLREDFPQEKIVGYFYDPNIHPYHEFILRYEDVKRSCKKMGIKVYLGEYDYENWINGAKGLENEPERGKRCEFCFDYRIDNSAKFAQKIGENIITTTLLMSPKKSHEQLVKSMQKTCQSSNLEFYAPNYRKNGGTNEQFALAKKDKLYRQNYCGCIFALQQQRAQTYELMNPLNAQILPACIEEKIKFYEKIRNLEKNGKEFSVIKDKFLNYRLLWGLVKFNQKAVYSYFLYNSHFKKDVIKFEITENCDFYSSDKDQVKIISVKKFNLLNSSNFKNIKEILSAKLKIKKEIDLRDKICSFNSLSPIIIVDEIYPCKVVIHAKSVIFEDTRELLL